MSFTDWDLIFGETTGNWVNGDSGQQAVHSTLSSPLTLQGLDARDFLFLGASSARGTVFCPDSAMYPEFSNVPDTKAIQVTAWVRREQPGGGVANVGIGCKCGSWTPGSNSPPPGYFLILGGDSGNFGAPDKINLAFTNSSFSTSELYSDIRPGGAQSVWYQIRMEVSPVLNGATVDRDVVRAYVNDGTEATPVWTLMREETVLSTDPAWIPWNHGTNNRVGWFARCTRGGVGSPRVYIDSFEAKLKLR